MGGSRLRAIFRRGRRRLRSERGWSHQGRTEAPEPQESSACQPSFARAGNRPHEDTRRLQWVARKQLSVRLVMSSGRRHSAWFSKHRSSRIGIAVDSTHTPLPDSALSVRAYRGTYDTHCHSHAQVLMGMRGSLQLEVDGYRAFVDPSCGLVIPAGTRHGYLADSPAQVLVVDCNPARGTDRLRRFALPTAWQAEPYAWTAELLLAKVIGAPTLQTRRRIDLAYLAMRVDAELHRDWTVAELAGLCRFSPQRFRARFAEITGMTPLTWVRQRRLDTAQRLLRAGWPLETAALQVGYASASALCFALRRDRGLGARKLRAMAASVRASLDI